MNILLLVFSVTQAQSMYSLWCGCRIMWGRCHNFPGAAILLLLASTLPPCVFGGQKSNNLAKPADARSLQEILRNQLWWILWFLSCSDTHVFSQSRTLGSRTQVDEVFDDVIAQPRDSDVPRDWYVQHRQKGPNHDNSPKPKWWWNGRSVFLLSLRHSMSFTAKTKKRETGWYGRLCLEIRFLDPKLAAKQSRFRNSRLLVLAEI